MDSAILEMAMSPDFSNLNSNDFLLGVFGAAFIETYRFKTLTERGKFRWRFPHLPVHIIWVLTFLAGSGLLAAVQGVSPELSAFYAGLTSPVFFATIFKDNNTAERELQELRDDLSQGQRNQQDLTAENTRLRENNEILEGRLNQVLTLNTQGAIVASEDVTSIVPVEKSTKDAEDPLLMLLATITLLTQSLRFIPIADPLYTQIQQEIPQIAALAASGGIVNEPITVTLHDFEKDMQQSQRKTKLSSLLKAIIAIITTIFTRGAYDNTLTTSQENDLVQVLISFLEGIYTVWKYVKAFLVIGIVLIIGIAIFTASRGIIVLILNNIWQFLTESELVPAVIFSSVAILFLAMRQLQRWALRNENFQLFLSGLF